MLSIDFQVKRLVAHLESERDARNKVNQDLQVLMKKSGNGKIGLREIIAWSSAVGAGLAAFVQYLK